MIIFVLFKVHLGFSINHLNISNIINGKRKRRAPIRYENEVYASEEYKRMMLCDIPDTELNAALVDTDFSEENTDDEEDGGAGDFYGDANDQEDFTQGLQNQPS